MICISWQYMGGPPASPADVRPLTRTQIERFFRLALEWQEILRVYREARQESPAVNAHWALGADPGLHHGTGPAG